MLFERDIMNFSNSVHVIWEVSLAEVLMSNREFIEPEHLLIGIFSLDKVVNLFKTNERSEERV